LYKQLGLSNTEITFYTSWLYLPWVIKPLWSPFIDLIKTKRWWIVTMELLIGAAFGGVAFTIPTSFWLQGTLFFFWVMAFASATHDIAADGFYMLGLDEHNQAWFVGIRSTFYRLATIFGQGILVMIAGNLQVIYRNSISYSWSLMFYGVTGLFIALWLWHSYVLPKPESKDNQETEDVAEETTVQKLYGLVEKSERKDYFRKLILYTVIVYVLVFGISLLLPTVKSFFYSIFYIYLVIALFYTISPGFRDTLSTFFTKFPTREVVIGILFMLFYRMPEGLLAKVSALFLIDAAHNGGMGLSPQEYGLVQGTVGVIGLTLGGILGGICAGKDGLKKWLWPMVCAITLPDIVYVYLSYALNSNLAIINVCVFIEQFGYGFGFTAYMLYLIYYSKGEFKTSHYALCTAFMALSMMIPGLFAGALQEAVGYRNFFVIVMICCAVTFIVTSLLKIDPEFGKKEKE
jgi:PAT family beta-lactamase induction signal transducer AmpG